MLCLSKRISWRGSLFRGCLGHAKQRRCHVCLYDISFPNKGFNVNVVVHHMIIIARRWLFTSSSRNKDAMRHDSLFSVVFHFGFNLRTCHSTCDRTAVVDGEIADAGGGCL